MTGSLVNAAAIVLGSAMTWACHHEMRETSQRQLKLGLAVAVMLTGGYLLWKSTSGSLLKHLQQGMLLSLGILIGNGIGRSLGIQKKLNKLAVRAKKTFSQADRKEGFKMASLLFCMTPLAFIGAVLDGLSGQWIPLGIKSIMDGAAAFSFTRIFGAPIMLSAIPVLVFEAYLSLIIRWLSQSYMSPQVIDGISAMAGILLIVSMLLITGIGKPRLADYLPSLLVIIPLSAWFW